MSIVFLLGARKTGGIHGFVWIWLLIVLEANFIIIQIGKDLERSL